MNLWGFLDAHAGGIGLLVFLALWFFSPMWRCDCDCEGDDE